MPRIIMKKIICEEDGLLTGIYKANYSNPQWMLYMIFEYGGSYFGWFFLFLDFRRKGSNKQEQGLACYEWLSEC